MDDEVGRDASEAHGAPGDREPAGHREEPPAWGAPPPRPGWGLPRPAGQPTLPPYPPYAGTPYGHHPGFGYPPAAYAFPHLHREPREPIRWTWRLVAGLTVLALVAGIAGGVIAGWWVDRGRTTITLHQPPGPQPSRPPDSVAGLASVTLPGVVYIHASNAGQEATGTGFVLDGRGDILTNNHVVADAVDGGSIQVVFNGGEQTTARVVGRDTGYDLAVIRVDGVKGLSPLPLGNSDTVAVGDPVIAIGAPYNLTGTVTTGIISAKDRAVSAGEGGSDVSYISALQTDAPINPGNSGGPLVDASGRVIGVNSAIRSAGSGGSSPFGGGSSPSGSIGLGFAIPINQAKRVAQQLIDNGRAVHPVIGVTLDVQYTGDGARVSDKDVKGQPPVRPGGPAGKAGIQPGDVVTAIDGKKVKDANELIIAIRAKAPGDKVTLTVQRAGKEQTARVTLDGETGNG